MNVLGNVPHDGIGASSEAIFQRPVRHHAEILRFVDDHMARFPDSVSLFDPLVQISERRQIIEIKRILSKRNLLSLFLLRREEFPIKPENGAFPHILPEMPAVKAFELFFLFRRIGHVFSGNLIFQL